MSFAIAIALDVCGGLASPPSASGGMWIRADQIPPGAVATWTDISGSGHSPTQPIPAAQPINTAGAGPNGLSGVVFASASSQSVALTNALVGTKNFTVAIVGKATSTAAIQALAASGNASNGFVFGIDINGTSRRDFNANGVVAVTDNTNVATTNFEAWVFTSDASGNLSLIVNGTAHTLSVASTTASAPAANFSVGALAGTRYLNGTIFEVIVYPTALSAANITALVAYQRAVTALW